MKKLALVLCIALLSTALFSCSDTEKETNKTTEPEKETTTKSETEPTTETSPEPVPAYDIDTEFAGITMYDTTSTEQCASVISALDENELPEKIGLHYTDFTDLYILASVQKSASSVKILLDVIYCEGQKIVPNLNIIHEGTVWKDMNLAGDTALAPKMYCDQYTVFAHTTMSSRCGAALIISKGGYKAFPFDDTTGYRIYQKDNTLCYTKTALQYGASHQSVYVLLEEYQSDDDFFQEYGTITMENGQLVQTVQKTETVGEYYQSDDFAYPQYRDHYGYATMSEFHAEYLRCNAAHEPLAIS